MDDKDDPSTNVRTIPLDRDAVVRHGLEIFRMWAETQRPAPPDPHAAELELYDRIVFQLVAVGSTTESAIEQAKRVIRARRALRDLT